MTTYSTCPYCHQDSAGNHQQDCPNWPKLDLTPLPAITITITDDVNKKAKAYIKALEVLAVQSVPKCVSCGDELNSENIMCKCMQKQLDELIASKQFPSSELCDNPNCPWKYCGFKDQNKCSKYQPNRQDEPKYTIGEIRAYLEGKMICGIDMDNFPQNTQLRIAKDNLENPLDGIGATTSACEQAEPPSHTDRLAKYDELIMAVCRCFPNESRHETALRYIKEAENRINYEQQDILSAVTKEANDHIR